MTTMNSGGGVAAPDHWRLCLFRFFAARRCRLGCRFDAEVIGGACGKGSVLYGLMAAERGMAVAPTLMGWVREGARPSSIGCERRSRQRSGVGPWPRGAEGAAGWYHGCGG
eukprot:TRINITY_DN1496_c0_g1_i1.p2 TRINITY_DN1496_c0_g1~~TRINITY_DN1496_c0_g1_i1.p2  ORF type:complete len:111 (-),score=2.29 TRINITY_DN1496_c0_g1_i1:90-422(-)